MKKLRNALKGKKFIAFLDFEGTQFSHEMIAIGAIFVSLNKDGTIKNRKKPFKIYVQAKNKIGNYVTELTGINEKLLQDKGVSFDTAMKELKKYIGVNFNRSIFMTFGNHDLRILNQSISYNFVFPKEICSNIQKNYVDFASIFSEFVRDEKGNTLSLVHACELYGVPLFGEPHQPEVDAVNLANLYDAFIKNKELTLDKYKFAITKTNHLPEPIDRIMKKLAKGEDVTNDEYETFLKDYID